MFEEEITEQMINYFRRRTNMHIKAVQTFAERILKNKEIMKFINREEFINDIKNHDQSKFEEPEFLPYVKLTWQHKMDKFSGYKKPGTIQDKDIDAMTVHHIVQNAHHPEYWSDQRDNLINKNDRDKPSKTIVNATKMPLTYVASMTADWMAMSKELNNSPYDWIKKNIGIRWNFNENQIKFIYLILDNIWEK